MKLDAVLMGEPSTAASAAVAAEADGYHALFSTEGPHDGFLPLAIAAHNTARIELGTSIAIAFSRSPMSLAYLGHDLQLLSSGRFILGLGSQIKPHIERRYSMPWSRPAARMREMVLAIQAIWRCWNEGEPLKFEGEFYTHTLMSPMVSPRASPHGPPRIWVAAVGDRMAQITGEVADGVICHPLLSPLYLRERLLPAVATGASSVGRSASDLEVAAMILVATGEDDAELARAVAMTKGRLAFYASTPAYRPVLDLHGWGDLQPELRRMTKEGDWLTMGDLIDDEMVRTLAIVAEPDQLPVALEERYGKLLDRVVLSMAHEPNIRALAPVLGAYGQRAGTPA
ncbi:MAG: TIGR03617 family F420-dependent LLM class oxidoreductase [Acidimicrobiales bacterium]